MRNTRGYDEKTAAVFLTMLVFVLAGCTPYLKDGPVVGPKTYRVAAGVRTQAFDRYYNLHIPAGFQPDRPVPLVVVVHGAFDTAEGMARFSGFSDLADREGFVVMYPEGIGILGYLQHWNAGHCCGKAAEDEIDDVGFVAHAIDAVCRRFDISRVYMLGFSNGGMFVHRFAAERGHLLDGAAALAAATGSQVEGTPSSWQLPTPQAPVAMMLIHGTADTDVPLGGGASARSGARRVYPSTAEDAAFWRRANGCSDHGETSSRRDGAVEETRWTQCQSGKPVVQMVLRDWAHIWPGPYFTATLPAGHPLKGYDAAADVWSFFVRQ